MAESQSALGPDWLDAWLEAPIWNFALSPGVCGPDAAVGVWVPSVDRVGRYFPLMVALLGGEAEALPGLARDHGGFLAAAGRACFDALEQDIAPEDLATRVMEAVCEPPPTEPFEFPAGAAVWWTAGAPRVPPSIRVGAAMPGPEAFAAMLDARVRAVESNTEPEE
jgi:type VI secretion system protein ImpM